MIKRLSIVTSTLLLALMFTSCVNLKPKPDATKIYMLGSSVTASMDLSKLPAYYVGRTEQPNYLQGSRMYVRTTEGELDSVKAARWAEELANALPRALTEHLQVTGKVSVPAYYPWPKTVRDMPTITVRFERFGATADGSIEVVAQWQVKRKDDIIKRGRFVAEGLLWDGISAVEYTAGLNSGLQALAAEIVAGL